MPSPNINPIDIDPAGAALRGFRNSVIALQDVDPKRMAGDLDTIASGLLALHLLMDRVIAARVELRMEATSEAAE